MKPRQLTAVLASAFVMFGIPGCGERPPVLSGCLVGYDDGGIALIELGDGRKEYIRPREEGHFWTMPVWNARTGTFICTDKETSVYLVPPHSGRVSAIYSAPAHWTVSSITVMADGTVVLVIASNGSKQRLVTVDAKSGASRVVLDGWLTGPDLMPVDADRVAIGHLLNFERGQKAEPKYGICTISVRDGSVRELFEIEEATRCAISADGGLVFISGPGDTLRIYDVKAGGMRQLDGSSLLGRQMGERPCFIGSVAVGLFREVDTMAPLGLYRFDITTGASSRISRSSVSYPTFLTSDPVARPSGHQ